MDGLKDKAKLKEKINALKKTNVKKMADFRLLEFERKKSESNEEWYSEMCFCILTANSRAKTAINIQKELGFRGFFEKSLEELKDAISKNKHRFSGMKSKYLVEARKHREIKSHINQLIEKGQEAVRNDLAQNILGIGMKESSHFLRNIGFFELAILDRHILRLMDEYELIEEIPKALSKKEYLRIEQIFQKLAKEMNMSCAELDLYMWYMKTGEVLK